MLLLLIYKSFENFSVQEEKIIPYNSSVKITEKESKPIIHIWIGVKACKYKYSYLSFLANIYNSILQGIILYSNVALNQRIKIFRLPFICPCFAYFSNLSPLGFALCCWFIQLWPTSAPNPSVYLLFPWFTLFRDWKPIISLSPLLSLSIPFPSGNYSYSLCL